jgi:hypothetical protein
MGDGNTYDDYKTDFDNFLPTWNNFVNSGTIDKLITYSIDDDDVLRDLEKLADNGEDVVSEYPIALSSIDDLPSAVQDSVVTPAHGYFSELIDMDFGADGGHIESITIGSVTETYDENDLVKILEGEQGDYRINFETGEYNYVPNQTPTEDVVEEITISAVDGDGDTVEETVTVTIGVDEILTFDGTTDIDAGAGFDTLTIDGDINLDFSDANMANIANIEKIDMADGQHEISNLSLDDVLDITDTNNTLIISGDDADAVNSVNTNGWTKDTNHTDSDASDGFNEYVYDNGSGDSITLKVEENIDHTGL